MSAPLRRHRRAARGFTLVELAIVVAIVGVLAVIGIVAYRKYMLNARITEAKSMVGAIRLAQEAHRSEKGTYASLGSTNWCPNDAPTGKKITGWNPACDGGSGRWQTLPVHTDGPVVFGYKTVAGTTGNAPNTTFFTGMVDYTAGRPGPWYVVGAMCDLNDDGLTNTQVIGSSYDNVIRTANDGS